MSSWLVDDTLQARSSGPVASRARPASSVRRPSWNACSAAAAWGAWSDAGDPGAGGGARSGAGSVDREAAIEGAGRGDAVDGRDPEPEPGGEVVADGAV